MAGPNIPIANLVASVTGDARPLYRTLGSVESTLGSFSGKITGLFAGVTIGAAGEALFDATKKAADLNETLSKVDQVFGDSSNIVKATADDLAGKFGIVKQSTLDAASNIGLIGKAAGLTGQASAQLGSDFARLAADASSFYNVPVEVALEKIRSGLVGESEPIRSFGVLLTETAVKAEALRLGLAEAGDKLSEGAKVQARASLITKGLATAQGDLERTAGSAANQYRKLLGDIENAKATIGQNFIEPMTQGIGLAQDLGREFSATFGTGPIEAFGQFLTTVLTTMRTLSEVSRSIKLPGAGSTSLGKTNEVLDFVTGQGLLKGLAASLLSPETLTRAANKVAGNKPVTPAIVPRPAVAVPGLGESIGQRTGNLTSLNILLSGAQRIASLAGKIDLTKKVDQREGVGQVSSLEQFAAQLQEGALRKDEPARETARNTGRMAGLLEKIQDALKQPQKTAAAVATGPE